MVDSGIPRKTETTCHSFSPGGPELANIMTTQDVAKYLKLHPITICKFAGEGKIPGVQIGRVWRFDKEVIDRWIGGRQPEISDQIRRTIIQKKSRNKRASRRKG